MELILLGMLLGWLFRKSEQQEKAEQKRREQMLAMHGYDVFGP